MSARVCMYVVGCADAREALSLNTGETERREKEEEVGMVGTYVWTYG